MTTHSHHTPTLITQNPQREKISLQWGLVGLHCASCVLKIERHLKKVSGIDSVRINLTLHSIALEYFPDDISPSKIQKEIESLGYQTHSLHSHLEHLHARHKKLFHKFIASFALSIPLMILSMKHDLVHSTHFLPSALVSIGQWVLATLVLLIGGDFFKNGVRTLFQTRLATMDTLISLGVGSAYVYSLASLINSLFAYSHWVAPKLYFETAGFLITFILMGRWLEALAQGRTSQAIEKLFALQPKTAIRLEGLNEIEIPIEDLKMNDLIVVKPAAQIPTDGTLVEGHAWVDEAPLTGESLPVEKNIGSQVLGGTFNKTGRFIFKVTTVGHQTVLAQIVRCVESAQSAKAPMAALADQVAAVAVPIILGVAIIAGLVWLWVGSSFIFALNIFISVLIISCPCALGLATPTALMVATGMAARHCILLKNSKYLQLAHHIKLIVLDKTGILTKGRPELTDIVVYEGMNENDLLTIAATVENNSEHPLGEAIVKEAQRRGLPLLQFMNFESIPGLGVRATIAGEAILLGNQKFLKEAGINILLAANDLRTFDHQKKSSIILVKAKKVCGIIAIADPLHTNSRLTIQQLQKLGKNVRILSGDQRSVVAYMAHELGDLPFDGEVLPQEKAERIAEFQKQGLFVAMVGDGINDAPALTQADLGISVGTGTDLAIEASDVVLMKSDLQDLVRLVRMAKITQQIIKENFFWAFLYNGIGIPIATGIFYSATGYLLNPMISGLAMTLSSISVVFNAMRLRLYKF